MKKLMFVAALCIAVIFANAQDQKVTTTKTKTTEKTVQKSTKSMVKEADLVQPIKDDLAKNYVGAKVDKAWKLESKGVETFMVVILKDNQKWDLTYDKDGKFIKKTEVKKMEGKKMPKKEMKKTEEAPKM